MVGKLFSSCLIGVIYGILPAIDLNCTLPIKNRIDCGYFGITKEECLGRGCCWVPCTEGRGPWCFLRKDLRETWWKTDFSGPDRTKYRSDNGTLIEIKFSGNGAKTGRITIERNNNAEGSLLFRDFYRWKVSNQIPLDIDIKFGKSEPKFSAEREGETMFTFDNLIWENNFIVFEIHFAKYSKVIFLSNLWFMDSVIKLEVSLEVMDDGRFIRGTCLPSQGPIYTALIHLL